MLRRAFLSVVACLVVPAAAHAFEAVLQIDEAASFVDQASPGAAGIYRLPAGGQVRFVFGEPQGDVVPVSIPLGGLQVGALDGDGLPALRIRLASPASGTLAIGGANAGALEVDATVVAETVDGPKSITYLLRFSTASTPLIGRDQSWDGLAVRQADRYVQLVATARVRDDRIQDAGNFYVVLSGQFDRLPEGVE